MYTPESSSWRVLSAHLLVFPHICIHVVSSSSCTILLIEPICYPQPVITAGPSFMPLFFCSLEGFHSAGGRQRHIWTLEFAPQQRVNFSRPFFPPHISSDIHLVIILRESISCVWKVPTHYAATNPTLPERSSSARTFCQVIPGGTSGLRLHRRRRRLLG